MRCYKVLAWLAGICLFLASCTDGTRYVQALPADAALVSSVDLESLAGKAGLRDGDKGTALADRFKKAFGDLGSLNSVVDKVLRNPSECGLALNDKLYFFMGAHASSAGILLRVADEDKVDDLLERLSEQQICESLHKMDGGKWTTAGKFLIAYSDVAFLMLMSPQGGNPADLQHQAGRLLRQDENEGFGVSSDYEKLSSEQGDVVTFASLNLLPQTYLTSLVMGTSTELDPQHIQLLASLEFLEGKAVLDVQVSAATEEMIRQLKKFQESGKQIKGTFLDCFPANTGLWIASNMNGKKIYELLNEIPMVRRKFQHTMIPLDFQSIFEAIEGNVVLAFSDPMLSQAFMAYAEVTNRDFLQTFEDLKPLLAMSGGQMKLMNRGTDSYVFQASDGSVFGWRPGPVMFWLGLNGNHFYVTNHEALIGRKVLGLSLRDAKWKNQVEEKRFLAAFNLSSVMKEGNYALVNSPDGQHIHVEWVMNKQDRNSLQQLLHLAGF